MITILKGFIRLNDDFISEKDGDIYVDDESAFGRSQKEVFEKVVMIHPEKTPSLTGNCFRSYEGFECFYEHRKRFCKAQVDELKILDALRKYVLDCENIPVVLAISSNRSVDKILEKNEFISLENVINQQV